MPRKRSETTLEKVRARLARGGFLVVVHTNADVDAVASAAALFFTYPGCALAAPGGLSRQGKALAAKLGLEVFSEKLLIPPGKVVVVVDAAGPEMVACELPPDSVIIDHHVANKAWEGHLYLAESARPSCSEVILEIIGPEIGKEAARALLYGIAADTGGFRHAVPSTFRDFALLLERSGESAEEPFSIFQDVPEEMSQRIARLKAAQRLRVVQEGDVLIGTSQIGAYEAEACRMLLSIGCDIALAGRQEGREFRVSGRARPSVDVSLAELMSQVAQEFGGTGGGHPCAAGMSGSGDAEAAVSACVAGIIERLRAASRA
jgi:nanoRNase/pAp phosphatase (c-di-AMP/oligoRNAs hydrolase)